MLRRRIGWHGLQLPLPLLPWYGEREGRGCEGQGGANGASGVAGVDNVWGKGAGKTWAEVERGRKFWEPPLNVPA